MKIFRLSLLVASLLTFGCTSAPFVGSLRTEYSEEALGIDVENPRFSWNISDSGYGVSQQAYRVVVATSDKYLSSGPYVYDSGKILSSDCVGISYDGESLKSRTRYYWQVTVWDQDGHKHTSDASWFETGLMGDGFGQARWIGSPAFNLSRYRAFFVLDSDFSVAEGSDVASFAFGALDEDNYQRLSFKLSNPQVMILSSVIDGVEIVRESQPIAGVISSGQVHHVTMSVDGPREYSIHVSLDGKPVGGGAAFRVPSLEDSDGRAIYARLYHFGLAQPEGQTATFFNLLITEKYWNAILFSDSKRYEIKGDGKVKLRRGADEVSAPMLRKSFNVSKGLVSARLYATSRGVNEVYINGQKVGQDWLNPGWTDYNKRIMYNTYDVTDLLHRGANGIGAVLGTGWFSDMVGHNSSWHDQYGIRQSFIAMLVLKYADGTTETIGTDSRWKCFNKGPVIENGLFNGEDYDARQEVAGWTEGTFDDSEWSPVQVAEAPSTSVELQGYVGLGIRNHITLKAQSVHKFGDRYIYDFGQNVSGVERLSGMKGAAGQQITIRFAEMLYPEITPESPVAPLTVEKYEALKGQMYLDNYRSAISTDHYTFKGDPEGETYMPRFTTHGFRYLSIDGLDEPLPLDCVEALALESIGEQTSFFETSNPDVNRLFDNIVWGERGNFLSVPTDCPQRDERLGWTGDAQVFSRAATYNMLDVDQFYTRWFYTVRDDQDVDGGYAGYYPDLGIPPVGFDNHSGMKCGGWQEVGVIVPWQVYQQYGDVGFVASHYDSMHRFMDFLQAKAGEDFLQTEGGTGDWLAPVSTDTKLSNTAYSGYAAWIMERMALALGHAKDAQTYHRYYENIKSAFNSAFVNPDGMTVVDGRLVDTQTSYVLGLEFGLFNDENAPKAVAHLLRKVRESGYTLTTGFIGTPYICNVLSDAGHSEEAYKLFVQTEYPSWLFPVKQGATTMWERWNSYTVKDGFGPAGMNSFNHYSYGAIEEWMMSHCLGIQRDETHPGYKHFFLQPEIDASLEYARGGFETMYGPIRSSWELTPDGYRYKASVPANTTATLRLPASAVETVKGGEFVKLNIVDGVATCELCPGEYEFLIIHTIVLHLLIHHEKETILNRGFSPDDCGSICSESEGYRQDC